MYPTIIELFGIEISSFGFMVGIAFLVSGYLAARSFERAGLPGDDGWRVTVWALVGGIAGSKLWYAFEHLARGEGGNLVELFFARVGLTWYGGLVGGVVASLLCIRVTKLPWLTVFNCAAPSLAIGQALGRVGCFLVGDDYGRVTDAPWGIAFPNGLPPTEAPVHPTMLYEMAWLVPVFAWLWSRRGRSPFLFGEYLFFAGLGRLWIEAFRTNPVLVASLSNAQAVALACMVAGAWGWLYLRGHHT
ncbi:MAG: prolipoprotein diacylglyceryl transferase [Myxococcales bacterium]|nr:prolipoprotein diacylglyceryl transferase [Myxococcales bacterium]